MVRGVSGPGPHGHDRVDGPGERRSDEASASVGRGAELIRRLASGEAGALSGRMIHVEDDLDELLARADEVRERGLYELRLVRGLEEPGPA